jgi:hypothetical protein
MITDPRQRIAISNLGWVDHGGVCIYDVESGRSERIALGDARYLTLRGASGKHFAAVHHFDGAGLTVTIQSFERPAEIVGRIQVAGWRAEIDGSRAVWETVPAHFVGWLKGGADAAGGYCLVTRAGDRAEVTRLDWFDRTYDWDYQSVVAVEAVPGSGELVFGVARSSRLVVTDAATPQVVKRQVDLAGRFGNPVPHIREHARELWAVDYDTVVRVDYGRWTVTGTSRLQRGLTGTQMFVGDAWIAPAGDYLAVPRPGSGDVVLLNTTDLRVSRSISLGHEPLEAAVLSDGRVVARDWKTGADLIAAGD